MEALLIVTLVVVVVGVGLARPLQARGSAPTGSIELATSSPYGVVLHGPFLVINDDDGFTAHRIEGGSVAWRAAPCDGAMLAGPVSTVDEGRLAYRCGETLGVLDLATGEVRWETELDGQPTTLRMGSGVVAVSLGDRVRVYAGATGEVLLEHQRPSGEFEDLMVGIGRDRVYVGEDRGVHAYRLDGEALWSADRVIPSTIVEVGWLVLVRYENDISALDISDGRVRTTTWIDAADASYSAAVTVGDGVAVLVGGAGGPFGVEANQVLQLAWEHPEPAQFVAAADGVILVATADEVVALQASDGAAVGTCPGDAWLATVDRTRIACGRADGDALHVEVRALS